MRPNQLGVRRDIAALVSSEEADEVTQRMAKIYYRLLFAPEEWWDSNDAMRVRGGKREGVATAAWAELVNHLGVPSEEAQQALEWMQDKEIITYRVHEGGREIEISMAGLYFPE